MDHLFEDYESQQNGQAIGLYTLKELESIVGVGSVVSGGVSGKEEQKEEPTQAGVELKLKRTDTSVDMSVDCDCQGCAILARVLGL